MTTKDLAVIQEKIGYEFREPYLLAQAFIRRSFAAENQNYEDNEKLEFVGDKVLDFIVVKKLVKSFAFKATTLLQSLESVDKGEKPSSENVTEGEILAFTQNETEMTEIKKQIVQTSFLAKIADRLDLAKYLVMGKGDIKGGVGNEPHVKEDLIEAIIGAVAIDSEWDIPVIEGVVEGMLNLSYHIKNGVDDGVDYVSYVQNWHQKEYSRAPDYVFCVFDNGTAFSCNLHLVGYVGADFEGIAESKKAAQRLVAKRAYEYIIEKEKQSSSVMKVIGSFDFDSAVGKLQMLADKRMISGVRYIFTEQPPTKDSSGNPTWFCRCEVDGVDACIEYGNTTKMLAKKAAAYEMLKVISGRTDFSTLFDTKSIMTLEI